MLPKLSKLVSCIGAPSLPRLSSSIDKVVDRAEWSTKLEKHFLGEFSFAVVQANADLEDHSQVEISPHALFAGIYDGHGGAQAARYVRENLFLEHLTLSTRENGTMSEDVIRNAFAATEENFLAHVGQIFGVRPEIAHSGSCCLVGIIWGERLYVANLGDSRAVIGREGWGNGIVAEQLNVEHNTRFPAVRAELQRLHPSDPNIVFQRNGAWRVKGLIQVSRSIGDAYLKRPEFALDESFPRFHLPTPLTEAVLSAEPIVFSMPLGPNDKFLILASDGLWEHMSNEEAVDFVSTNPRSGVARKLLRMALNKAAERGYRTYKEVTKIDVGRRRNYHDDITVIVIFIDHGVSRRNTAVTEQSIRGFIRGTGPSHFRNFRGNNASSSSAGGNNASSSSAGGNNATSSSAGGKHVISASLNFL